MYEWSRLQQCLLLQRENTCLNDACDFGEKTELESVHLIKLQKTKVSVVTSQSKSVFNVSVLVGLYFQN